VIESSHSSAIGATIEAPRGVRRGEGMSPSPMGEGLCPLPRKFFSIFSLKIAIFDAFWAAIFTVRRTVLYADNAD